LETFLEAILRKSFHFFCRILNYVSTVLSLLISVMGAGKNQLQSGQERMGDATMLPYFYLLRNP
jgi:hypothetical protein